MQLPHNTCLTLTVTDGERTNRYTAFAVGHTRWGISTTLPQILQRAYAVPAGTKVVVQYLNGRLPVQFESYVLGYQETSPPTMVLAEPKELLRNERRESLRLPVELPVGYMTRGSQVTGERTNTVDISLGGVGILSDLELPIGTWVSVFLTLPSGSYNLEGRVAWCGFRGRLHTTGVEFRNVSETTARVLALFMFNLERQLGPRGSGQEGQGSHTGR
ncbi:MAG TPA: PilZ domain-containing protein [Symbiobacteriaceae bacterium]|jgi:c-di-GMP-binding flagellar brake protein YcgR